MTPKKTSFGKAEKKSHFLPFFLWGHEFPSFSPIFQKRDRLRRRRREQRRIRNGHHHREIPRHRDHRWGRTSPFVAVFPSLFLGCVTLHERSARISLFFVNPGRTMNAQHAEEEGEGSFGLAAATETIRQAHKNKLTKKNCPFDYLHLLP